MTFWGDQWEFARELWALSKDTHVIFVFIQGDVLYTHFSFGSGVILLGGFNEAVAYIEQWTNVAFQHQEG